MWFFYCRSMQGDHIMARGHSPVNCATRHSVTRLAWPNTGLCIRRRRCSNVNSAAKRSSGRVPSARTFWYTQTPDPTPANSAASGSIRKAIWRSTPTFTLVRNAHIYLSIRKNQTYMKPDIVPNITISKVCLRLFLINRWNTFSWCSASAELLTTIPSRRLYG